MRREKKKRFRSDGVRMDTCQCDGDCAMYKLRSCGMYEVEKRREGSLVDLGTKGKMDVVDVTRHVWRAERGRASNDGRWQSRKYRAKISDVS